MTGSDKKTKNFLGIPVHGDITHGEKRAAQRPLEDLEPLIRAVLDDPYIHSFGWTQYTPYFNDGEPCVFSVGTPWFRTVDDAKAAAEKRAEVKTDGHSNWDDDDDDEDDWRDDGSLDVAYGHHPTLGKREYEWDRPRDYETRQKVWGAYEGEHEVSFMACVALSDAIGSDAFEDVLLVAFGDHCQVTIKATGITVDEYSHD